MAIKINGQDLLKRYINGQEIVRVYKNGGQIRPETVPPVFDDYLCFTAEESNSTVSLNKTYNPRVVSLEISYNKSVWADYTIGTTITLSNIGDKVYIRNKSETPTEFSRGGAGYYTFSLSGEIAASGDVTSLLCKNGTNTIQGEYCFVNLFDMCTSLVSAPKLPATTLTRGCYSNMFFSCTSLRTPPLELPATTLTESCYSGMFSYCTSLEQSPEIRATILDFYSCYMMFSQCSSLVNAPQLLATNLAEGCYYRMFEYCGLLSTLPKLPATNLEVDCYRLMFDACTSIKLSETQTGEYQTPYRIPTSGTGIVDTNSLIGAFRDTGGTFTGTPSINTTYYTSNQVI